MRNTLALIAAVALWALAHRAHGQVYNFFPPPGCTYNSTTAQIGSACLQPAGSTTQVQLNAAGSLGGNANFTFNPATNFLGLNGFAQLTDQTPPSTPASTFLDLFSTPFLSSGISQLTALDTFGGSISLGIEMHMVVFNSTGVTLNPGSLVYINGSHARTPTVALAQANSAATLPAVGFTQYTIANNAYGEVHTIGSVTTTTTGTSVGQQVYVSDATPGAFTVTAPTAAGSYAQQVGVITNVAGAGAGNIQLLFKTPLAAATPTGFANPTGLIGLTAVNGTATTAEHSDSTHALDQSIAPTMTGLWNFTHAANTTPAPVTINSALNMLQMASTRARGTGGAYILITDPTGQKGCIGFCSSGSDDFYFENDLPSATHFYSNGIDRIGADANGSIFMNQPTGGTGNTLLINLPVGHYGLLVGSNAITAGNSFGEEIQAGTNTSDNSLAVINQAATLTYFRIRGDGEIFGGGPVAGAQIDMTPDASTFTATYTGMTAATTCTASWSRMGQIAVLVLCAATGTSNATTFTMTGLPSAIQPASLTQQVVVLSQPAVTNNGAGAATPVDAVITNGSGTITFRLNGGTAGWTAANAKGFANALSIAYSLK